MQHEGRFRQALTVGGDAIDALGHVSNITYVRWVQDAARAHSEHLGYDHERYQQLGAVFVVRRHQLDYLKPVFEGETLSIYTWVDKFKAATSLRHTSVVRDSDGVEVMKASTTWAFISTENGRPLRIPLQMKEHFYAPIATEADEGKPAKKGKSAAKEKPAKKSKSVDKDKPAKKAKRKTAGKDEPAAKPKTKSSGRKKRPSRAFEPIRPFLKWAGGKRQLLEQMAPHVPGQYGRYFEPFVGAGALFFHLGPRKAVLADNNERLMRTFRGLRDEPDRVIELLKTYPHDKDFFLKFRKKAIDDESDAEVAAWLIYLNKTAFNGLYRVNSKNIFNVPFGRYKRPNICDEKRLRACAERLQQADIRGPCDFVDAVKGAKKGDLVYFDPPYAPLSDTSYFTSYTAGGFGEADQKRLRDTAVKLMKRGVQVLVSNSSAPLIDELYDDKHFERVEMSARRNINSKVQGRGKLTELLLVSRS